MHVVAWAYPPELVTAVTAAPENPVRHELKTLADVRGLVERRLPNGHRQRSAWQHVEKQLNTAALGKAETIDVAVPLRLGAAV